MEVLKLKRRIWYLLINSLSEIVKNFWKISRERLVLALKYSVLAITVLYSGFLCEQIYTPISFRCCITKLYVSSLSTTIYIQVPSTKSEEVKLKSDDVTRVLIDVTSVKDKQEAMNTKLDKLKR